MCTAPWAFFDHDNGIVYNHLKGLVLDGPGWAWIQQFDQQHDGCAAWLCLIGQYKGLVNFNCLVDTAKAKIERNMQYHGSPQHHYTFDKHVTKFQNKLTELDRLQKPYLQEDAV